MKTALFIPFLLLVFNTKINAQYPPAIQWQKLFGGTKDDNAYSVHQTYDKGYIIAGYTKSNDGNIPAGSNPNNRLRVWILKTDSLGILKWQKLIGSNGSYAVSVQQTKDSGYVVASIDSLWGYNGSIDYRITKLSSTGDIQWARNFGGTKTDIAKDVKQTTDGGYIVAGYTTSNDTDVTGNHGSTDYWIIKLNSAGVKQWQKCLGGSSDDMVSSIQATKDDGFIIAGSSRSNNGDVSGHHIAPPQFTGGFFDYWIVKLNSLGNIQWQKSLGGTYHDFASSVQQTTDGGYIVAGYTESNDGDVSVNHDTVGSPIGYSYFPDYWVVRLDSAGNLKWQQSLGGRWDERATSIIESIDGSFIVAGSAQSRDGDVGPYHNIGNSFEGWIVKLDNLGTIRWKKIIHNYSSDITNNLINDIKPTIDGSFVSVGMNTDGSGTRKDLSLIKFSASTTACTESYSLIRDTICAGTAYSFNGTILTQSGVYRDTLNNANSINCDSIITLALVVKTAPTVSNITGVSSICVGTITTYSDSTAGGIWSSSNTNIATVNSTGIVTGIASGTTTINYTVTNINGCSKTTTKLITVNTLPTVEAITGASSVCAGSSTTFNSATSGGIWNSNATNIATVNSTGIVTGIAAGTSTISYTVTSNGCSKTATKIILVNTLPNVAAITGASSVCVGSSTTFNSTTLGGVWSSNATNIATVNSTGIVTGIAAGTSTISYTVTSNGCNKSVGKSIIINPVPANGSILQSNDTLYSNVNISGATYNWYRNGSLYTTTTNPYLKISSIGSYILQIISNGCLSSSPVFTVSTTTAISNNTSNINSFDIYPNPTSEVINVNIQSKQNNSVQLQIFDVNGKQVYIQNLSILKGRNLTEININHLQKGIYIIYIEDKTGIATDKFIVK
jgi:uncharacterized protein YjdB